MINKSARRHRSSTPRQRGAKLSKTTSITANKEVEKKLSRYLSRVLDAETEMGYWDLEEGKDCISKTWITTKLATAIGLVGSAYHIVAYQPETAVEALTRATSGTATMAAMGAIFGMATCLSAQARDAPDDPTNYFIGGCASGVFLGARSTAACFGLGTVAMLTKVGKKEGWRVTGPPRL